MAINVWGTQGTVNEVQWAKLAEGFGQKYTLVSGNAVTSSGRNLSIPARVSIGCGVAVEVTTAETRAVSIPAAGQWFLLVLRRQWGASRGATFELIPGPTTTDAVQTAPPAALPAARNKTPGLIDDEPVAWVHARASVTTLTIWQMQTKRDGRIPGIWAMYDANEQGLYTVFAEADNTEYVLINGVWHGAWNIVMEAGPAGSLRAQYRKVGSMIEMRGIGTKAANTYNLFTLPSGYRPAITLNIHDIATPGGSSQSNIQITSAGSVNHTNLNSAWVSLDLVRFGVV